MLALPHANFLRASFITYFLQHLVQSEHKWLQLPQIIGLFVDVSAKPQYLFIAAEIPFFHNSPLRPELMEDSLLMDCDAIILVETEAFAETQNEDSQ